MTRPVPQRPVCHRKPCIPQAGMQLLARSALWPRDEAKGHGRGVRRGHRGPGTCGESTCDGSAAPWSLSREWAASALGVGKESAGGE